MEWMFLPFKRYTDFSGRSRRMEYWMFTLLNVIVSVVLTLLAFILVGADRSALEDGSLFQGAGLVIFGFLAIWGLAVIIPSIAVTVRRLHDREMSGWWYLGFIVLSVIPVVNLISSIAFLVILVLPGTPGDNRFGADPKDPYRAEAFT